MRAFLVSHLGAVCVAAVALPLAVTAGAAVPEAPAVPQPSGSTRTLPITGLGLDRGLPARPVEPFSLVGVTWDDAAADLHGTVQVRTRATGGGTWSPWQDIQTHSDDAPDRDSAERRAGAVRGSSAPLWVGDSDAVQVRVLPDESHTGGPHTGNRAKAPAGSLPAGLRLEMVHPGDGSAAAGPGEGGLEEGTSEAADEIVGASQETVAAGLVLPELGLEQTLREAGAEAAAGHPYIGPRPRIVTRKGWNADERLRKGRFPYTGRVKAAFIHHSASGNDYRCSEAPSLIRAIYRYHVKSSGWRDIGYNFLVDKCGNIYEGRAGGVARPVLGAHTLGFNTDSMGVAVLGTYSRTPPPPAALHGVAQLTAWKLGLFGMNPSGDTYLVSAGSNKYKKGVRVRLGVISGHRDGFRTECPGARLYDRLGTARSSAAGLQGR